MLEFSTVGTVFMETTFTPWNSLLGGALVGTAAVLFLWGCGRVMGVSGVLSRLIPGQPSGGDELKMRWAFVLGVLLMPIVGLLSGQLQQVNAVNSSPVLLAIAGLAVGYGTVRGNGCTSGHGVCGLSRLSQRSMVATVVFMGLAAVTVYVSRHMMGWI